jgi:hypothetical protein
MLAGCGETLLLMPNGGRCSFTDFYLTQTAAKLQMAQSKDNKCEKTFLIGQIHSFTTTIPFMTELSPWKIVRLRKLPESAEAHDSMLLVVTWLDH